MADLKIDSERLYDVIIIGGGPAGLTAALYLARSRYRVLVVEKGSFGGQITITSDVVNYPGILKTSGSQLTETMRQQAQSFGAELLAAEVEGFSADSDIKTVKTSQGEFSCFGILLATGATPRSVGFKGETEYKGQGVAYCATCDGEFFTGKEVFVIGGGFAAAEESVFLTRFASHVTILIRKGDFSCARSAADAARSHEKITVLTNTVVEEVSGSNGLTYIRYKNTATGQVTEYRSENGDSFGVFVFAGYSPASELVRGIADLNEQGYIITDTSQKTSVDGLYAAGDVCIKPLRQVVTAVGDGAIAATELEKYAAAMQQKTGLKPVIPQPQKPEIENAPSRGTGPISDEMAASLTGVFSSMAQPLTLKLYLDHRDISRELEEYMSCLAKLTDKLTIETVREPSPTGFAPNVTICRKDGSPTGLAFHGVPGGHEFTSFVMGLYNAAGPGQPLDDDTSRDIASINGPLDMKILVSLSCTMCPELVIAAQRIAASNESVTAHVYDVNHFPQLRERYNIMSVPCLVVNDSKVSFGRKNLRQLLDFVLEK